MKILFLSFFSILTSISLFGQIEIRMHSDKVVSSDGEVSIDFTVINNGSEEAQFYWELETMPVDPTKWEITAIYDLITCWPSGTERTLCESDFTNIIQAQDSVTYYTIKINTEDDFEEGCIVYRLIDDCASTTPDTLLETNFKFCASLQIALKKTGRKTLKKIV